MTATLIDLAEASAFLVADADSPGVVCAVSGPYLTLYYERLPGHYEALDGVNPIHHEEAGDNGLYGQDAARLYDEARAACRFEHPSQVEAEALDSEAVLDWDIGGSDHAHQTHADPRLDDGRCVLCGIEAVTT